VIVFGFAITGGGAQTGLLYKKMYKRELATAAAFFGGALGCSVSYVLYWGVPSSWAWAIAIPVVILGTIIAMATAAAN
jgi:hypothetical protein